MNKKIIAIGISALSAAALTFGTVAPATAVVPAADSLSGLVCTGLDDMLVDLGDVLGLNTTDVDAKRDAFVTAKNALELALNELAPAVVAHVQAVSDGVSSAGTGQILAGKSAIFADKFYAAHNAITAQWEAERTQYINGLSNGYIDDVKTGLCV